MNTAITTLLLALIPWVLCSGEGNIRLLEDEVAVALKSCNYPGDNGSKGTKERQKRSEDSYNQSPRIDDGLKQINKYGHERRNSTGQGQLFNASEYDVGLETAVTSWEVRNEDQVNRARRNEPLFNKPDTDQCLSQCVFANLQVVDSRGIPREAELWNKIQDSVASQQSRAALRDQIRACFQELQSEAEDDGCSYSNKLERCLMLRFSDRKTGAAKNKQDTEQEKQKPAA